MLYFLSYWRLKNAQSYGEELGLLASLVLAGGAVPRVIKTRGKPVPLVLLAVALYGGTVFGLAVKEKRG